MKGTGRIFAFDKDSERLKTLRASVERTGCSSMRGFCNSLFHALFRYHAYARGLS